MKRHGLDVLSLVFGFLFLAVAGASASESLDLSLLRFEWVAAIALLAAGATLLLSARRRDEGDES